MMYVSAIFSKTGGLDMIVWLHLVGSKRPKVFQTFWASSIAKSSVLGNSTQPQKAKKIVERWNTLNSEFCKNFVRYGKKQQTLWKTWNSNSCSSSLAQQPLPVKACLYPLVNWAWLSVIYCYHSRIVSPTYGGTVYSGLEPMTGMLVRNSNYYFNFNRLWSSDELLYSRLIRSQTWLLNWTLDCSL